MSSSAKIYQLCVKGRDGKCMTIKGQLIHEIGFLEGAAFADWGYLFVFEMVAQMLRPYGTE
ncbi:hypothetical protein [Pseudanabaena sp. ABRG5-3]|uniref:hypothetical protein n=1 Tax=Pseudanabaena sp. ABRG5-3 TaxID=685565 RepID=UPI000DC73869|nr:hypothetical protein [Pseudanabaena sp. ABRG5-3]BBC26466.1 hypothetical protein ABRG53_4209 [Pseudanabaena sp. ABRG5-3]